MSERGNFRGGGRGGGGAHRGGRGGNKGAAAGASQQERPKKENILDLAKYMDKQVTVKFNGGREGRLSPTILHESPG
jgi:U6 snRNA-associated Sm-like protein LSm7